MTKINIAQIALQNVIYPIDKLYDYYIPDDLISEVNIGTRVVVPFGTINRKQKGIVLNIKGETEHKTIKPILMVADSNAVLDDEFIKLAEFMKQRCFCTYYEAVRAMLPSGLNFKISEKLLINKQIFQDNTQLDEISQEIFNYISNNDKSTKDIIKQLFLEEGEKKLKDLIKKGLVNTNTSLLRKTKDATLKIVSLNITNEELSEYNKKNIAKFPKHIKILNLLIENGDMSEKEILYMTGGNSSTIKTLYKRGIITIFEQEAFRRPEKFLVENDNNFSLSIEQEKAYNSIKESQKNGYNVTVLNGITGSGKTHIFIKLIDDLLEVGKGVIYLVPEISLTSQILNRFYSRYGDKVAILHSALSLGERLDEWKRIKNKSAQIVIGTRSAIFAPVSNLGLIIIDEEQEHTYKSEMSPRFNAKDIARFRCSFHNASLILSSATPSIESYNNAINGKYKLVEINERYNNNPLPNVIVIDMRTELKNGNSGVISDKLRDEITENLHKGQQSILFLNRRGYNSFVSCRSCGFVAICPNCNISLTYHSKNNRLMCHYCGHSTENPSICPECKASNIRYFGSGTQRIEAELEILFSSAKIVRMDADSTIKKSSHDKIINDFSKGEYDILVGTQMVTKGLDFPNVTLVGVVAADLSLYSDDFKANEKTFDLITQVIGRAGRGENLGRAIIQTYTPENKILNLAFTQNYKEFFKQEIALRKSLVYPPFCDICQLIFEGQDEPEVAKAANRFAYKLQNLMNNKYKNVPIIGLGPNPAVIPKINNKYRYKLILKCRNDKAFRELITNITDEYYKDRENKGIYLTIDFNPEIIL